MAVAGRVRSLTELALQHGDAGLGMDVRRADVGDFAGDALDVAVHGLSCGISEDKPGCGLPRSVV